MTFEQFYWVVIGYHIEEVRNRSMNRNITQQKTYDFAVKIVILYKKITLEKKEFTLSKQLLRSGTSIGANVMEANGGISSADFSAKISISYKEALETKYWLNLLQDTEYISENTFLELISDCDEICKILFSILKSSSRIKSIINW